jgi:histidyl-tRNA synthetase
LGKQLKLAAARNAPRALIVGPDERARGVALLRDLVDGTETQVALERVEHALGNS